MKRKIDISEIQEFISKQTPETKIYLGCDSERYRMNDVWYADYILAVVIHIDGKHGCKLFGEVITERDYDQRRDKPKMRMMTETMKVAELYLKLAEILEDRDVEIHLDINPDERFGSSCAVNEAIGYIKGMCNVVPLVKPNAWAASYCADRLKSLKIA
jgi:predicted RNase H-related nuclease YkuK (DUF458 family)